MRRQQGRAVLNLGIATRRGIFNELSEDKTAYKHQRRELQGDLPTLHWAAAETSSVMHS